MEREGDQLATRAGAGAAWLALLVLASLLAASVRTVSPPPPLPADAPEDDFSAARALPHVRAIASQPHPVGSPQHDQVLAYLLEAFRAGGLEPQLQEGNLADTDLANVLARIRGRGRAGAILLAAHYDSAPARMRWHVPDRDATSDEGPPGIETLRLVATAPAAGAGDDGAAVAALIEVARILARGPPLERDVIVLLSDGEELGLLGARLFVREHPWASEVAVALNFEARGNAGPSILFQLGPRSHGLVDAFAEASPHPFGSSCGPAVYERMPNDTDFTVFADAGLPGLNLALCAGGSAYHQPWDTPENLQPGSLQHHGEHALALARALGNAAELPEDAGPRSFFNAIGFGFVHYPSLADGAVALAATVLLLLAYAVHRHSLRLRALAVALALVPASILVVSAAVGLAWLAASMPAALLARALAGAAEERGNWTSTLLASSGAALAAIGIASTVLAWTQRRGAKLSEIAVPACAWWIACGAWLLAAAPGAAYLATWPALFAALAALALPRDGAGWMRAWPVALASVLALALLLPTLHLFAFVGSTSPTATATIASAFAAMAVTALPLGLAPLARLHAPWPRRAALLAALVLFAAAGALDAAGR